MKKATFLFFIIFVSVQAYSQDWIWGIKATGSPQYSEDMDIAVDHEGNTVIAGYYQLGLNLGACSLYTADDYYSDIFLCRMDSQHHVQWLKHIETGTTYDYGIGVTTDDDKNIYVTGGMDGSIFASKYDSLGNQLWLCDFNRKFYGQGNDIAVDPFDNVYITGKNSGNTLVAKLDYDGNVVWTKQFIGCHSNGCQGNDIAVDEFGTIYVAGTFECESLMIDNFKVTFKYSWGDQTYVTKISTDGKVLWAISPEGATNSIPQIALTSNGFYLCGSATTPIDFGGIMLTKVAGGNDGNPFIARMTAMGKS